jgi:hypothetical protein
MRLRFMLVIISQPKAEGIRPVEKVSTFWPEVCPIPTACKPDSVHVPVETSRPQNWLGCRGPEVSQGPICQCDGKVAASLQACELRSRATMSLGFQIHLRWAMD